jgi:hypothetical protein
MTPSWMVFFAANQMLTGLPHPSPIRDTLMAIAPRPTMLVIAGQSELEVCNTQRWAANLEAVQTWILDTGHISGMTTHQDEYRKRLTAFFDGAYYGSDSQ